DSDFSVQDLTNKFKSIILENRYTASGHLFDIGHTTKTSLNNKDSETNLVDGNGAMMRILPVSFLNIREVNTRFNFVKEICHITHNSKHSTNCAFIYQETVRQASINNGLDYINYAKLICEFLALTDTS